MAASKAIVYRLDTAESAPKTHCLVATIGGALDFHGPLGWASSVVAVHETSSSGGPPHEAGHAVQESATNARVALWAPAAAPKGCVQVRLGHQQAVSHADRCPPTADDPSVESNDGQDAASAKLPPTVARSAPSVGVTPAITVRLAACAVAFDPVLNVVLLTRRPRAMRTFPGAWVVPGGSVDDTDPTVASAALRELKEETGLVGTNPQVLCAWESAFPPTADQWRDAKAAGRRTAHHLILFYTVLCDAAARLELQPEECDAACWVPVADFAAAADGDIKQATALTSTKYHRAAGCAAGPAVAAGLIHEGVYPNADGEGVGRGHLFALEQHAAATRTDPAAATLTRL